MPSTVTDGRHRFGDARVNNISGNVQRSRRWWQRNPQPQAPVVERSPYPNPAGDTQILPQVQIKPVTPPVLYRERPADLDKAACNITLAATTSRLHGWSAIKLEEHLAVHMRVVHGLAEQERAEGRKLLARNGNGAQAAAQIAETLGEIVSAEQKANELPGVTVKAVVDTGALGSELTAVTANEGALGDQTRTFRRIEPGMPDPRVRVSVTTVTVSKPASPVHVPGDGTHAALPAEDETADPGTNESLPQRAEPVNVLPATDADPSTAVDPTSDDAGLAYGSWIFDEGGGVTGPVWFKLARRHVEGDGVVRLDYCSGLHVDVRKGRQVRVLDPARAKELLAQHETALAERAS